MDKKLIFGIGTGRCGTVSLCELLNLQRFSNFTHESKPILPWKVSEQLINDKLNQILERDGLYLGDIAFYYLPYIDYILKHFPDSKFICLKRDRERVVNSYLKKTKGRNHWINHSGIFWKSDPMWDKSFPKYISILKKNALKKYWKDYYDEVSNLNKKYPQNILILDMNYALNTNGGIIELLTFLDIEIENLIVRKNILKNQS